jgi:hypothetical protein
MGNDSGLKIHNFGSTTIHTTEKPLLLSNILHVPEITNNLLSISQLTRDNDIIVEFTLSSCFVKDRATHKILLHGTLLNGLYQLDIQLNNNHVLLTNQASSLWHSRLVHCSPAVVTALHNKNKIISTSSKVSLCTDCCKAKAHKLQFSNSLTVTTAPLQLVHTDLWGPSPITSNSGNRYYIMFTDDFSRFSWIYCIACKSEVSKISAQFKVSVENLLSATIKTIQCDGGTEFKPLLTQYPAITFHISRPFTPEQNGLAERKHRHVVELNLATMFHASIPLSFWDVIFESVLFVINRLPRLSTSKQSPFQILFNQEPDYQFLKVIGCECFPLLRSYANHKLQPRSESCVFLGYSSHHKWYCRLHLPSNKIYISRHVKFNETVFHFVIANTFHPPSSTNAPHTNTLTILPSPATPSTTPISPPISSNSSPCIAHPSSPITIQNTHTMQTRQKTNIRHPKHFPDHHVYSTTTGTSDIEPTCYSQAVKYDHWRHAMAQKLDTLAKNHTRDLVDPPLNSHIIGCK